MIIDGSSHTLMPSKSLPAMVKKDNVKARCFTSIFSLLVGSPMLGAAFYGGGRQVLLIAAWFKTTTAPFLFHISLQK